MLSFLPRLTTEKPTPRVRGSLHPDFIPVAEALRKQLAGDIGGAAISVFHRGQCVVDIWGGTRDHAGRPWLADTMSPSFSTTKGVASTLVHIMADRGLLDYDERIATYWPEFARAGKAKITLRHVLSHQAGLYHIRQMIDQADRMLDWDHMIKAIERTRPIHKPGERTGYHGLTYGFLVGEVLQRVTQRSFSQLVHDELAAPLGLDGLYIGTPESELPRAAELMWPQQKQAIDYFSGSGLSSWLSWLPNTARNVSGFAHAGLQAAGFDVDFTSIVDALAPRGISSFDFGGPESLRTAIPAANGLFTARSLARMYAALANGGELDGVRLFSRQTFYRATEMQNEAPGRAVLPIDMRWRLGYHGIPTLRGFAPGAFGHFGFGGSGAWADPARHLSFAMIVNSGMGTPLGDMRTARMSGIALDCAKRSGRSLAEPTGYSTPLAARSALAQR